MADRPQVLLLDANVLIDYRDSELSILSLVCEHVAPVHVIREVLDEVAGVTATRSRELGIAVIDLEARELLEISTLPRRLSRRDRLSFLACRIHDWVCVTNDRPLRRSCEEHGIRVRWGLELMVDLVAAEALTIVRALSTARIIQANNPHHITAAVLERFERRLRR